VNEEQPAGDQPASPPPAEGVTESGYSYTVVDDSGAPAPATESATGNGEAPERKPRGRALPVLIVGAVALLAGAAIGFGVALLTGDGDDGGERAGADTASVIHAFSQGQGVDVTRYERTLPQGFPEIPTYDGAAVVSSLEQLSGENAGYLAVYDTSDSRDDVVSWYREKFAEDPWQVDAGQDGEESTLFRFSKIDDANVSGVVLIGESTVSDITTILVSAEVISAEAGERPDYEPGVSKPLPEGFPSDVPQYPDAVVIETAFERQSGSDGYAISLITTDEASSVLDFYSDAFGDQGWEVSEGDASQSSLEDAAAITFLGGEPETSGSVTTGVFTKDRNYTQIDLQVRTSN
jgi:hypothetical protein